MDNFSHSTPKTMSFQIDHIYLILTMDAFVQMNSVVSDMAGNRLKYNQLIADNGLDSGARETTQSIPRT